MDAAAALADLTEISSQVQAAAVVDAAGTVLAATGDAERLAQVGGDLFEAADDDFGRNRSVTRLEIALREGSVFALREGGLLLVARTSPGAPSALVLYDLASCLEAIDAPTRKKPRTRSKPKAQATADA
jgi:hypothetical protein